MNKRQLIGAIVEKTGIKLGEDDPAFVLVELNRMMLESQTSEAAEQLTEATKDFKNVTTQNIDDFVAVTNEALSKFKQCTNEIKASLDNVPKTPAALKIDQNEQPETLRSFWWLLPFMFCIGVLVGVCVTIVFMK